MNKKPKKTIALLLASVSALIVLFLIFNYFHIVKIYKEVNTLNEPNIHLGSLVFVSALKKPQIDNFVAFKHYDTLVGNYEAMFRVMGMANDTVELKNGLFFRNGKNIDQAISLSHSFLIGRTTLNKLKSASQIISERKIFWIDTFLVEVNDDVAKDFNIEKQRVMKAPSVTDELIERVYNKSWNKDNFGPLVIPTDKFFVLGDNRDNAYDSRYIGLIDASDIIGSYFYSW